MVVRKMIENRDGKFVRYGIRVVPKDMELIDNLMEVQIADSVTLERQGSIVNWTIFKYL